MFWPSAEDYNSAVQTPELCFADPDLLAAQPECGPLGLPIPRSGAFAAVYQLRSEGRTWAVKCFTKPAPGRVARYAAVHRYLPGQNLPFLIGCEFLEQGIWVKEQWFPVVKMEWVEGHLLHEFTRDSLTNLPRLERLFTIWTKVVAAMEDRQIVHGDFQHGNILVVPGESGARGTVTLVDYDGMTVPGLETGVSIDEVGHVEYQHPVRTRQRKGGGPGADRFPALVIATALRGVRVAGSELWDRFHEDNLLFKQKDFEAPEASPVFAAFREIDDRLTRQLVGALERSCREPMESTPPLSYVLDGTPTALLFPAQPKPASKPDLPAQPELASNSELSALDDDAGIETIPDEMLSEPEPEPPIPTPMPAHPQQLYWQGHAPPPQPTYPPPYPHPMPVYHPPVVYPQPAAVRVAVVPPPPPAPVPVPSPEVESVFVPPPRRKSKKRKSQGDVPSLVKVVLPVVAVAAVLVIGMGVVLPGMLRGEKPKPTVAEREPEPEQRSQPQLKKETPKKESFPPKDRPTTLATPNPPRSELVDMLRNRATTQQRAGQVVFAADTWALVVARDPSASECVTSAALSSRLGRWEQIEKACEAYDKLSPRPFDSIMLLYRASALAGMPGRLADSQAALMRSDALFPNEVENWFNIGAVRLLQKDQQKFSQLLTAALQQEPVFRNKTPRAPYLVARMAGLAPITLADQDRILGLAQTGLQVERFGPWAWQGIGTVRLRRGEYAAALVAFGEALKDTTWPAHMCTYMGRALALHGQGLTAQAKTAYTQALREAETGSQPIHIHDLLAYLVLKAEADPLLADR